MTASRLLKPWAIPPASVPSDSMRCASCSCRCSLRCVLVARSVNPSIYAANRYSLGLTTEQNSDLFLFRVGAGPGRQFRRCGRCKTTHKRYNSGDSGLEEKCLFQSDQGRRIWSARLQDIVMEQKR